MSGSGAAALRASSHNAEITCEGALMRIVRRGTERRERDGVTRRAHHCPLRQVHLVVLRRPKTARSKTGEASVNEPTTACCDPKPCPASLR